MSTGRWSGARLDRTYEAMAAHVERGEVPGLVTLVARRGEVRADAVGAKAVGGDPMRRDTIFRISSLTKPIAAAAAMVLVEDGRLRLDEPVDRLLPELADRRVLKRLDGPLEETVPAKRPITLRDLLSLRMGFGFVLGRRTRTPSWPPRTSSGWAWGRRSRPHRTSRTSGSAVSRRCRLCTSRANGGCTRWGSPCWAC